MPVGVYAPDRRLNLAAFTNKPCMEEHAAYSALLVGLDFRVSRGPQHPQKALGLKLPGNGVCDAPCLAHRAAHETGIHRGVGQGMDDRP